jgi:hypothetical protein
MSLEQPSLLQSCRMSTRNGVQFSTATARPAM